MIKFSVVASEIKAGVIRFCMEQKPFCNAAERAEITSFADSAFAVLDKYPDVYVSVTEVFRFFIYAGEEYTNEILPFSTYTKGILYKNSIVIGSVNTNQYYDDSVYSKGVICGYDIVYDLDTHTVKPIYRILVSDESVESIYRVNADIYEDFNPYEFIINVTSYLMSAFRESLVTSFIVKNVNTKEAA